MFLGGHPWAGGESDIGEGREFDPVGFVAIVVKFFVEFILGDWVSGYAGWGNLFPGDPGNGVKDELAVAFNGPVPMVVAAGEAGSASAPRAGNSPEEGLGFPFGEVGSSGPDIIDTEEILLGWGSSSEVEGIGVEFDIEVKFIHRGNGADPTGSFMAFFRFYICPPEWVDGDPVLEKTTDPGKVVLFALLNGWVNRVVHEQNAGFFLFDQLIHFFPSASDHLGAIGVDHDGIDIIQYGFIRWPTMVNRGLKIYFFLGIYVFGKEVGSGFKLMVSGSVTLGSV